MSGIRFAYVANSGVLVNCGEIRVLIDGIYGKNDYFSQPVKEMQKAVFGMNSRYRDIDCLVFTHRHIDHFSSSYLNKYLQTNRVERVYLPAASAKECAFEDGGAVKSPALIEVPEGSYFSDHYRGIDIRFFRCTHTGGDEFAPVRHYMVSLGYGTETAVFAADADCDPENLSPLEKLPHIDRIFVDPLFFAKAAGRRFLERKKIGEVVVYHVPFEGEDVTGLRAVAEKCRLLGEGAPYRVTVLDTNSKP